MAIPSLPWDPYRHRVEILLLPATAGAAGTAFGWACLHLSALLLPGWPTPVWLHAALCVAALAGVYVTFAQVALRLPIALRILEVCALLVITSVCGLLFASADLVFELGQMRFQFLPTAMLLTLLTWAAATYLGVIGPNLLPAPQAQHLDPSVEERLVEMKGEHEVYGRARLQRAGQAVWVRFGILVAFLLISYVIITLIFGARPADTMFSLSGSLLLASGLSLCALTQLVTRRRLWERDHQTRLPGDVTQVWPLMTAAVAIALVVLALIVPANISPLYAIDWDRVMTGVTERLFGNVGRLEPPLGQSLHRGAQPQSAPMPSGAGGTPAYDLAVPILILALLFLLGRAAWQALSVAIGEESLRARGILRLLAFVLAWPYAIIRLAFVLIARAFAQNQAGRVEKGSHSAKGRPAARTQGESVDVHPDLAVTTIRQMYRKLIEQAKRTGRGRQPEQTAQEFGEYLAQEIPERRTEIEGISASYEWARYSRHTVPESMFERFHKWWQRTVDTLR